MTPTLKEYDEITKDILRKITFKKPHLYRRYYNDTELFGELVNAVIDADAGHDPTKSKLSTRRINYVKWKMLSLYNGVNGICIKKDPRFCSDEYENPSVLCKGSTVIVRHSDNKEWKSWPEKLRLDKEKTLLYNLIESSELTPAQQKIINLKYFQNASTKEITRQLGVTKQYVSLVIKEAIERIRKANNITVGDKTVH